MINLEAVRSENRVFRYDTQYYSKAALGVEARIKEGVWEELVDLADGVESFGAYALTNEFSYQDGGVPFLRCVNIRGGFTDFGDVLYIDESANKLLAKSEVKPGMVLLTMSGSVGNAAVALPAWRYPVNSNQDIAKITPKQGVDPYFITAFLGSKYGAVQMERLPVGSVQQHIFLWMIEKLAISRFSSKLERKIGGIVLRAYQSEADSVTMGAQAEHTLLCLLGLEGWEPPEPLTYTRRASEALAAARFDAEYFAPRVAQLLAKLSADGLTIHDFAPARHEAFDASKHKADSFHYIEISGLRSDGTATSEPTLTEEAPSRASQKVHGGDIITSTVRPIRRLSAIIGPDQHGHVCSSGFVVLEPKAIAPEVLLTYLRLPVICELMDLHTSASLYPAISERDLLKLPIPRIPNKAAQTIITQIRQAHAARQEAQALLTKAKRAVEVAIEEGEERAFEHLKS